MSRRGDALTGDGTLCSGDHKRCDRVGTRDTAFFICFDLRGAIAAIGPAPLGLALLVAVDLLPIAT